MSAAEDQDARPRPVAAEEPLDRYERQLCRQCRHAFVWHGVGVGSPDVPEFYVPQGCGVLGCKCDRLDPEGV